MPVPIAPLLILVLCVIGGIGTVLLLPGRREASFRRIGGVLLVAAGLILIATLTRWTAGNANWGGPQQVYFWIFSAIAIVSALRVVTHPKPIYSALYFILTVFASAGLFLLVKAEFMAAALVLIYAGAILITYVFVIMLAAEASNAPAGLGMAEHDRISRDPLLASAIGFTLMGVLLFVVFDRYAAITPISTPESTIVDGLTQQLGAYLFSTQLISLELAGLLLTVAMVGAIVISQRQLDPNTPADLMLGPMLNLPDDPHAIPVYGTTNPRQKEFPQT